MKEYCIYILSSISVPLAVNDHRHLIFTGPDSTKSSADRWKFCAVEQRLQYLPTVSQTKRSTRPGAIFTPLARWQVKGLHSSTTSHTHMTSTSINSVTKKLWSTLAFNVGHRESVGSSKNTWHVALVDLRWVVRSIYKDQAVVDLKPIWVCACFCEIMHDGSWQV